MGLISRVRLRFENFSSMENCGEKIKLEFSKNVGEKIKLEFSNCLEITKREEHEYKVSTCKKTDKFV